MSIAAADSVLHAALATLPAGANVLLGFSGGLDSSVLLHALAAYRRFALRAMHIHHGLNADADRWAQHCQWVCTALDVPLAIVHVQVPSDSGEGLEAAARRARYAAFATGLQPGEWLLTAHHRDDQAETVLLRLLRGSGAGGLSAMRTLRPFANGQHWRPLLGTSRRTLLAYAQAHALEWIDDPSNAIQHHDRNFLRHRIMPVLHERWPHAEAALARSAALLAEQEQLLDAETARHLAQVQGIDKATLVASELQKFPAPWRARILRHWITTLDLPALPRQGVTQIEQALLWARADAEAQFRWGNAVIHRWRDLLHACRVVPDFPAAWRVAWDGQSPLPLPTGDVLTVSIRLPVSTPSSGSGSKLNPALAATVPGSFDVFQVAARQGGERITLPGRLHSHALKNVLQDHAIPPWQRQRLPLIFAADGELLAVGDTIVSARAQAMGWRLQLAAEAAGPSSTSLAN